MFPASRRAAATAILALALVAHLPILRAGYVQDDAIAIEKNPVAIRGDLGEILSSSYWKGSEGDDNALYRPVVIASYALEHRLGGPWAPASHTINLILHLGVAAILVALARRLGLDPTGAAVAGALFAVHPAKSEAVFNVVGRAEILAALFGLGALLAFTHARARPRAAAWGAGLLLLLGLLSKEGAAVVPVLMIVVDLALRGLPRRNDIVPRLACFAPSALALLVFAVLRTRALEAFFPLQGIPVFDNPLLAAAPLPRLATALDLVTRYAEILVVPWRLANDWAGPSIPIAPSLVGARPLLGAAILLLGVGSAAAPAVSALRGGSPTPRARALAVAASVALVPYLLVGNLLLSVGVIFAERLLYLPAAGVALAVGVALSGRTLGRAFRAGLAIALLLLAARSFARARDWKDEITAFEATIRSNPRSARAWFALGTLRSEPEAGRPPLRAEEDEALDALDRALGLWPDLPNAWHQKGLVLARRNELDRAAAALTEAVARKPQLAVAWLNLGLVRQRQGRMDEARRALRKAALWDPGLHRAWASLGHVDFDLGSWTESAEAYRRAVALGRDDLRPRLEEASRRAGAEPLARRGEP